MTPTEYLQANEYRRRLVGMLELAAQHLSPDDLAGFAGSLRVQIEHLDERLRGYIEAAHFSYWVGMKTTAAVVCEEVVPTTANVLWNSPIPSFPGLIAKMEKQLNLPWVDDEKSSSHRLCFV